MATCIDAVLWQSCAISCEPRTFMMRRCAMMHQTFLASRRLECSTATLLRSKSLSSFSRTAMKLALGSQSTKRGRVLHNVTKARNDQMRKHLHLSAAFFAFDRSNSSQRRCFASFLHVSANCCGITWRQPSGRCASRHNANTCEGRAISLHVGNVSPLSFNTMCSVVWWLGSS